MAGGGTSANRGEMRRDLKAFAGLPERPTERSSDDGFGTEYLSRSPDRDQSRELPRSGHGIS